MTRRAKTPVRRRTVFETVGRSGRIPSPSRGPDNAPVGPQFKGFFPCSNLMHPHIQIRSSKINGKEDCHERITTGQQPDRWVGAGARPGIPIPIWFLADLEK